MIFQNKGLEMNTIIRPPNEDIAVSPVAVQQYIYALEQQFADLQSVIGKHSDALRRVQALADAALRNVGPSDQEEEDGSPNPTPLLYEL
ncbi:MAG: hypothetical protein ACI9MJ_000331 [Alphaproteobacteria bacterium]|jgi:hypothetical protein